MTDKPNPGVIGSLPRTRPHRRSDKRGTSAAPPADAQGVAAEVPQAAAAAPSNEAPAPAGAGPAAAVPSAPHAPGSENAVTTDPTHATVRTSAEEAQLAMATPQAQAAADIRPKRARARRTPAKPAAVSATEDQAVSPKSEPAKTKAAAPKGTAATPTVTATPKATAATPKPKATTPRPKAATSTAKAAAPKPKAATPKPKAAAPKPKAAAPKPKAATPRPKPATPKARATPKPAATPRPRTRPATPPPPAPEQSAHGPLETAVQAAAELAEIGLQAGARALRRAVSRLPRT